MPDVIENFRDGLQAAENGNAMAAITGYYEANRLDGEIRNPEGAPVTREQLNAYANARVGSLRAMMQGENNPQFLSDLAQSLIGGFSVGGPKKVKEPEKWQFR